MASFQCDIVSAEKAIFSGSAEQLIAAGVSGDLGILRGHAPLLTELKPEVEFVAEQWPALFGIDAGAEVQALERAKPDAIYNVTFGPDLAKFVREGTTRGLFEDRAVYGLLSGEPTKSNISE